MEASKLLCFLSFLAVVSAVWACPSEEIIRQLTDEDAENSGILDAWGALLNAELHFLNFVKEYGKRYSGPEEQAHRFGVFKSNLLRALEQQKLHPTAIHGVSRFSDLTEEEFRQQYLGLRPPTFLRSGAHDAPILPTVDLPEDFDWREKGAPILDLPEDFDWREKGAGTEVKDQAEIARLIEEKNNIQNQLEELSKNLEDVGQKIHIQQKLKEIHDDPINVERRNTIKEAMLHAWTSYEKYAWGFDELQPQSRRGVNTFGGLGATIIDSLDTLYIMGLNEQFQKAKSWITSLDFNKGVDTSVFETTIRVLGGLLSAYDLSGENIFLDKAKQIADRLLPALRTPTGIPYSYINLANGHAHNPGWTGGSSVLADIGTIQVEFIALSQRTGIFIYQEKVENVINQIRQIFPMDGLVPIYVNPYTRRASSKITFGAMGDSFYEYLLKVWIQGNKTEAVKQYREMWEQSMEGLTSLIKKSTPSSFTYIAERSGGSLIDKMDELACFAPGMLALGAYSIDSDKSVKYMQLAEELAWTCYNFYQSTPTKLAGANYIFQQGQDMIVDTPWNIQRPETVESLMYLWRTTGNETYREWGWQIFKAFEAQCRVESGYVGLRDVNSGVKDNMMQSSFLAETLKYLYLLFSPPSTIPLDQWVFNNKAHPVKIMPRYGSKHEENDSKDTSGGNEMTINIFGRKKGRP